MTYKEIVDLIKTTCLDNYFINEFSYGNISDINTPEDEEPVNYPYAFLNPVSISQDEQQATLSANLIVMTQTYESQTDELLQQSNCIGYLNQIISHIQMNLDNPLVIFNTPFTITPFKERFSDNVVGGTASISISFPLGFDDCDTPYSGLCNQYQLLCNTNNFPVGSSGTFTYWKNATFESLLGNDYRVNCGGDYAMYKGVGIDGDPLVYGVWDVNGDGSVLQWQRGVITAGTVDCGNTITYVATISANRDEVLCEGTYYPSDLHGGMSYGQCQ